LALVPADWLVGLEPKVILATILDALLSVVPEELTVEG